MTSAPVSYLERLRLQDPVDLARHWVRTSTRGGRDMQHHDAIAPKIRAAQVAAAESKVTPDNYQPEPWLAEILDTL